LTINTDSDLSFMTIQQQTYRRKQLMDQADNNSLTALLTKRAQVRFCKIVNTCTERWAEKRIQRTAWKNAVWTCEWFVPSRMAQWAVY